MNKIFRNATISLLAPFALSACGSPPHTHKSDNGILPDAGYSWLNPDNIRSGKVMWVPGAANPDFSHIHAAQAEGQWEPDQGYGFTGTDGLTVAWKAGIESATNPHVSSAPNEGKWRPDDGYDWVDPSNATSMSVKWQAGQSNTQYPHIVSAEEEGKWSPEAGYKFVDPQKDVQVVWDPGSVNGAVAHITAGSLEGQWIADSGYEFVSRDGKTYVVPQNQPIDWGNVAADGVGAVAFNSCAQDQDGDGFFQTFIVRPACRQIRDGMIKDAVKTIAPAPQ